MDIENAKLTNLTTDGFVKTTGGDGSLTVAASGGGTTIKSIQRGTISWTTSSGDTTGTATITAVTTAKALVNHLGQNYTDSYGGTYLTLTNSTTVTAGAYCGQANSYKVSFEVIEFN